MSSRRPLSAWLAAALVAAALPGAAAATPSQQSHLVVIVGAGGGDVYTEAFHIWATELIDAAEDQLGMAPERITYLGEKLELDPDRIAARSTRENIEATLTRIAGEAGSDDQIFLVLIGHGSQQGPESRFNIPGRDLTAADYGALLSMFPTQKIAFVNTASASGDFVAVLSAPNRAIVTATRDGRQNNQTVFPRFFVEAFSEDVADVDKDGRISLLEAYGYASREVKRFYEDDGRMLTETAQLDDNADGAGSHEPDAAEADGILARGMFLSPGPAVTALTDGGPLSPELQALYDARQELQRRVEELRLMKSSMDPALYDQELERLLIELALKDREIREKGGK